VEEVYILSIEAYSCCANYRSPGFGTAATVYAVHKYAEEKVELVCFCCRD